MSISGIGSTQSQILDATDYTNAQNNQVGTLPSQNQPPDYQTMVSQLQAKLGLNDNQMIALKSILQNDLQGANQTSSTDQTQGTASAQGTKKNRHAAFQKLNQDIMSILNPTQQQAFQQLLQARQSNGQQQNPSNSQFSQLLQGQPNNANDVDSD